MAEPILSEEAQNELHEQPGMGKDSKHEPELLLAEPTSPNVSQKKLQGQPSTEEDAETDSDLDAELGWPRDSFLPDPIKSYPYGLETRIKNLYPGPPNYDGRTNWVEAYPADLKSAVKTMIDAERCAIVLRHQYSHGQSLQPLVLDSIVIQSPLLLEHLAKLFKGFPGLSFATRSVVLEAPFAPLYHKWQDLCKLREEPDCAEPDKLGEGDDHGSKQVELKKHMELLLGSVEAKFIEARTECDRLLADKLISFELMCFSVECEYIDWDGKGFGYVYDSFNIAPFEQTKEISSLAVYPINFANDPGDTRRELLERGRKFSLLAGLKYKAYHGKASMCLAPHCQTKTEIVEGRIMLDAGEAALAVPGMCPPMTPLAAKAYLPSVHRHVHYDNYLHDEASDQSIDTDPLSLCEMEADDELLKEELTAEQLLLCCPAHKGYSLTTKQWGLFDVDSIADINWSKDAFSSLILPGDHKEVLLSVVEAQLTKRSDDFDDIISGKGKGYLILLYGSPGVGKTLTAEGVAEEMKMPLYVMGSGELGSAVEAIEKRLIEILKLAAKWKAILLIDEAGVYLEQRQTADLERNRLVSVFLRILEYHSGLLFLTTNRLSAIDSAFESRIHLSLPYPDLDRVTRRTVWKNFALRGIRDESFELLDTDLDQLALLPLNGRQIKNVYKTACLLAERSRQVVNADLVRRALRVSCPGIKEEEVVVVEMKKGSGLECVIL